MSLTGLHHVTAICADARRNINFWSGVLGFRLVKRTVNFDAPEMHHLYYGDRTGAPGTIMTFFEMRGVPEGQAGAGMLHRVILGAPDPPAREAWATRLADAGAGVRTEPDGALISADPEGLAIEIALDPGWPPALLGGGVPPEIALTRIVGVRAFDVGGEPTREVLETLLGFTPDGDAHRVGEDRPARYLRDGPPAERGRSGAGTIHHVAWASTDARMTGWSDRLRRIGLGATRVIDRQYFHSVYFREPGGVLFEIASAEPGFLIDEDEPGLGTELRLPPQYEPHRGMIEDVLSPLPPSPPFPG